jgi:hypothetical protein
MVYVVVTSTCYIVYFILSSHSKALNFPYREAEECHRTLGNAEYAPSLVHSS